MKNLFICAFFCLVITSNVAALTPLDQLLRQSDLIVVGKLARAVYTDSELVEIEVSETLSGSTSAGTILAQVVPGKNSGIDRGIVPQSAVGSTGVWLLKVTNSGMYQVVPIVDSPSRMRDLSIPVAQTRLGAGGSTSLGGQLLGFLTTWYASLNNPGMSDDQIVYINLTRGDAIDGMNAAADLVSSPKRHQRMIGLAAAIRLGSIDALANLSRQVAELKSDPSFLWVRDSVSLFQPKEERAYLALDKLIGQSDDVAGLDDAVAQCLQRNPKREGLPLMARLLDSKDSRAQARAAQFFGYLTLFADDSGNIPGTGVVGPLATADTQQFTPGKQATLTPAQYADFWKVWWAQNRTKLGY